MRLTRRKTMILPLAAGLAGGWTSPAPDVVLYVLPDVRGVGDALARRFGARQGVPVHVFAAPPLGLIGLIRHRARDDVVVADAPTVEALATAGLVLPASVTTLGTDPYVLIGPRGMADAPLAEVLARRRVVVTDPTSAASFDGQAVLAAIAGKARLAAAPIGVATGPELLDAVARGPDLVGLARASAVFGTRLVRVVAAIPATLAPPVAMAGGLTKNGQSDKAATFLHFAASDGLRVLRQAGMEMAA